MTHYRNWRGGLVLLAIILACIAIGYLWDAFPGWMAGLGAG